MTRQLITLTLLLNIQTATIASDESSAPYNTPADCHLCSLLDRPQLVLSDKLLKLSDKLDIFFSKSRSYDKHNKSFASINYYIISEESKKSSSQFDTRMYITLPRTQERLTFKFQTEADSELDSDNPDIIPGNPNRNTNAASLSAEAFTGKNWRFNMDIGAEYKKSYDPFFRVAYNQNIIYEQWTIYWREAAFHLAKTGNGVTSSLRFVRNYNDKYILRISNKVTDYLDNNYTEPEHSISLSHKIDDFSAAAYAMGLFESNDPVDRVHYLQLRYKRLIHKTWLYYEIIPEILVTDSNNQKPIGKISLKLEYLLGNI
ncbi:MAG: hypothetical protein OEX12_02505 [Gammaproteobacteria bacterium]|nr:hypothetical protein [Gammaproteobacteria bacterium]